MREFFREFIKLGAQLTLCQALAIPLGWFLALYPPSIDDVFNMLNLRILLLLWSVSAIAAWLMVRE